MTKRSRSSGGTEGPEEKQQQKPEVDELLRGADVDSAVSSCKVVKLLGCFPEADDLPDMISVGRRFRGKAKGE